MNDFVAIEQAICPVCGNKHSHNMGILINKQLKPIKEEHTISGYSLCETHQKLFDNGFIALIEVNNTLSEENSESRLLMENADRTGNYVHMQKEVFDNVFNTRVDIGQELLFIDTEVYNMLVKFNNKIKQEE